MSRLVPLLYTLGHTDFGTMSAAGTDVIVYPGEVIFHSDGFGGTFPDTLAASQAGIGALLANHRPPFGVVTGDKGF